MEVCCSHNPFQVTSGVLTPSNPGFPPKILGKPRAWHIPTVWMAINVPLCHVLVLFFPKILMPTLRSPSVLRSFSGAAGTMTGWGAVPGDS